ncbi:MAG: hypothetical protein JO352_04545 [Chloroflexi bacterium]|nr:hypothetical protein [Chloroflexota bacterium]
MVMADDDEVCIDDVVVLDKQHEQLEHIGLSLDETKTLLRELQHQVVTRQIAAFLTSRAACTSCGWRLGTTITRPSSSALSLAILSSPARGCDGVPASTMDRWSSYYRSTPRPSWCIWRANGRRWSPTV